MVEGSWGGRFVLSAPSPSLLSFGSPASFSSQRAGRPSLGRIVGLIPTSLLGSTPTMVLNSQQRLVRDSYKSLLGRECRLAHVGQVSISHPISSGWGRVLQILLGGTSGLPIMIFWESGATGLGRWALPNVAEGNSYRGSCTRRLEIDVSRIRPWAGLWTSGLGRQPWMHLWDW